MLAPQADSRHRETLRAERLRALACIEVVQAFRGVNLKNRTARVAGQELSSWRDKLFTSGAQTQERRRKDPSASCRFASNWIGRSALKLAVANLVTTSPAWSALTVCLPDEPPARSRCVR